MRFCTKASGIFFSILTLKYHLVLPGKSQEFVMGDCCGGLGAEPPAAGGQWGSEGEAPSCQRLAPVAGGKGVWGRSPQRLAILKIFQQK